jgi:hypothetical protein
VTQLGDRLRYEAANADRPGQMKRLHEIADEVELVEARADVESDLRIKFQHQMDDLCQALEQYEGVGP